MKNLIIIISLVFLSCNQKREVEKLSIYYIGCLGECPQIKVEINSNGKIKYFGSYFSQKMGYYKGNIDSKTWDKIANYLIISDYRNLKDSYYLSADEEMNVELVINSKNNTKRVKGLITHYPPEIKNLLEFILKDINKWDLKPSSSKLLFDFISDNPIKPMFPPN
jgi:hypothetical protein